MPIRINLLAEAQAAEELRRRDPVKRAVIWGAVCVVLMVIASLAIQSQVLRAKHVADGYSKNIQSITNDFSAVMANSDRLNQINLNIRGLDILASERFLNGTLLNSLQKVYMDSVYLINIRTEHNYAVTEATRDKKDPKKVLKRGTSAEKITLIIEARDSSDNPGDRVNKYKEALAQTSYFQSLLGRENEIRLVNLSPPQTTGDSGRPVVQFTLESRPPEKVRMDISSPTRYATPEAAKPAPARKTPSGPARL